MHMPHRGSLVTNHPIMVILWIDVEGDNQSNFLLDVHLVNSAPTFHNQPHQSNRPGIQVTLEVAVDFVDYGDMVCSVAYLNVKTMMEEVDLGIHRVFYKILGVSCVVAPQAKRMS